MGDNGSGFNWVEHRDEAERATYDPDDDKIRIYTDFVPRPMFDAFRAAGFSRAPKQGCFFQVWTPHREDIALALCDTIEDEDSTLQERAEERYGRFAGYKANAGRRATEAMDASRKAVEGIPFGQPILVGHHSEKRHRRDIARAQRAADRAVEEFDRQDYWSWRAAGVLRNAGRKFNLGTVYRRIKKLKARVRKSKKDARTSPADRNKYCQSWIWAERREENELFWEKHGRGMRYHDLDPEDRRSFRETYIPGAIHRKRFYQRWIRHDEGLIGYWQKIYDEVRPDGLEGGAENQREIKKGYWVQSKRYGGWAQVVRVNKNREGMINSVSIDTKTYTRRFAIRIWDYENIKEIKTPEEYAAMSEGEQLGEDHTGFRGVKEKDPEKEEAREIAKKVSEVELEVRYDNDFHPTPFPVVSKMIDWLDIPSLLSIFGPNGPFLEPSSGDGRIIQEIKIKFPDVTVGFFETDQRCQVRSVNAGGIFLAEDFMQMLEYEIYAGVIMNPPYSNGQWRKHVQKAHRMLKQGGRLVALVPTGGIYGEFADWLTGVGGYRGEDLGSVFPGTKLETTIVVVEKE